MAIKSLTTARAATMAAAFFVSPIMLVPAQAEPARYTVNGFDYDVDVVFGSWIDNQVAISESPWWGDGAIASAFNDAVDTQPFTVRFAYSAVAGLVSFWDNSDDSIQTGTTGEPAIYAIATEVLPGPATSVPEINAGALSQVVLTLLALLLVSRGRREADILA